MRANVERPRTCYAKSGDVNIAYQVMGEGPLDLIVVPGWISNLDMHWQMLGYEAWVRRMTSFCRLIVFDKRGTGLSDRDVGDSTLEERMDDLRAVLDAAGSERAAVLGFSEGGSLAMLFAASHPERVRALVLFGAFPRTFEAPDFPEGELRLGAFNEIVRIVDEEWGEGKTLGAYVALAGKRARGRGVHGAFRACIAQPASRTQASQVDLRDRYPERRLQPARPHARDASHRRPADSGRRRTLARQQHSRRSLRGAAGRRSRALVRRHPAPRRGARGVLDRLPRRGRSSIASWPRCSSPTSSVRPNVP